MNLFKFLRTTDFHLHLGTGGTISLKNPPVVMNGINRPEDRGRQRRTHQNSKI